MQDSSFHAGHEFDHAGVTDILNKSIDDVVSEFAVRHLTAAEAEARLDLVAFIQEAHRLILLRLIVMLVDGDGEFHFLDGDNFLLFACGALALFLFVEISAVVLNAADWRDGIGRDFNQIKAPFAGDFQSLVGRQDAELLTVLIDDPDLAGADAVIDTDKGFCRTFVECDGTPPKCRFCQPGVAQLRGHSNAPLSIALAGFKRGKAAGAHFNEIASAARRMRDYFESTSAIGLPDFGTAA